MIYPYINEATGQVFDVEFPDGYALKLHGTVKDGDLTLDVKANRFLAIDIIEGVDFDVKDFYIVLTPTVKSNVLKFENPLQVDSAANKESLALAV